MIQLPKGNNRETVPIVPATTALSRTVSSAISAATSVTLNAATTLLEVNAKDQGIYMRYQAGVTASNADEFVLANSTRHYAVPPAVTVVSFIEETATAKLILIEK